MTCTTLHTTHCTQHTAFCTSYVEPERIYLLTSAKRNAERINQNPRSMVTPRGIISAQKLIPNVEIQITNQEKSFKDMTKS